MDTKANNGLVNRISIRLENNKNFKLRELCGKHQITISELLRGLIDRILKVKLEKK